MPTRRRVAALLLWVLVFPQVARAQDISEAELVDRILREGVQARAIRAVVDVTTREQLARAAFPNPIVAYTREGAGFTEFLQVDQFVPLFGSRAILARAGAAATQAAEAERDARLWHLRSEAQVLVARLLAEQQKTGTWRASIREVEGIIAVLRTREQEGEGSRFDRLRAEQDLAEARQFAVDAEANAAEAHAAISAALGADTRFSRATGTLDADRNVPPLDSLISRALSTRGELRALQSASDRFLLEASAARRARLPSPTVSAGLKRADADAGRQSGGLFGINVVVPLFDSGRREAARWLAERARADAERAFMAHAIQAQITGASAVLALRQDAARAAAAASVGDLTEIALVAYREGEVGILELLDAYRTVARARIRAVDMQFAARLAQIALERAVGDPLWP
jgi:cobalt-zinc-cadmium efflux system outer membrane protein